MLVAFIRMFSGLIIDCEKNIKALNSDHVLSVENKLLKV